MPTSLFTHPPSRPPARPSSMSDNEEEEEFVDTYLLDTGIGEVRPVGSTAPAARASQTSRYEVNVNTEDLGSVEANSLPLTLHVVFPFNIENDTTADAHFRTRPPSLEITINHSTKPPAVVVPLLCERDTGVWRAYVKFDLPFLKGGHFVVTFGSNIISEFDRSKICGAYFLDNVPSQVTQHQTAPGAPTDTPVQHAANEAYWPEDSAYPDDVE